MKSRRILLIPAVATLVAAASTVEWSTIDGGGGVSAGGAYTVAGTIGQCDTFRVSGGSYAISGGFWALPELLQAPGGPPLTISTTLGSAVLSWPAASPGWRLETSMDLVTWAPVSAAAVHAGDFFQVTQPITPGEPRRYFRLTIP